MKQIIYLLSIIACCTACEKVVDITVNNGETQLVIQGNVSNVTGPTIVQIRTTVPYSNTNVFPGISNAVVTITDSNANKIEPLQHTGNGVYQTNNILGIIGKTYILNVTINGKNYQAKSTMPTSINLDSITFQTNTGFGQVITNAVPNFKDPVNEQNNYYFNQFINSKPTKKIFVFDDRLINGRYINAQLFNDSAFIQKFDTVTLEMQTIDRNVFNFFKELELISDPSGPQPSSPQNPTTNISGGALGYFSAHTFQRKKAVFK